MNRSGKRHRPTHFDALDVPLVSRKKPLLHSGAHFTKFSVKLRKLLDQEKYAEAKLLFTEMVKSSKYDFKNLWQAGIEVIGRSSPHELVGYLKAVFISAPPKLSSETFNVYIDQLLIESKWTDALEEMELRYNTPTYHHPIILRKMAICAYHLWNKAYNELPDSYFEEQEHDQFDITHVKYQKYLRAATKYLAEAHQTYLRDSEIFEIYFSFLQKTKNTEMKKITVLKSLEAFNKDPEYYLLYSLMKRNKNNRYFNNDDFIIPLYEFDPFLDEKVKQLRSFCKKTIRKLKSLEENSDEEERARLNKLLVQLFRLFVTRVEHGNVELWFCRVVVKMCTVHMCQEMEDVYFYYNVDELLRTTKSAPLHDRKEIVVSAIQLKAIVSEFILQNGSEKSPRESMERSLTSAEGQSEERISNDVFSIANEDPDMDLGSLFLLEESFYNENDTAEKIHDQSNDSHGTSDDSNDRSDESSITNDGDDDINYAAFIKQEEVKKTLEDSIHEGKITPDQDEIVQFKKEPVDVDNHGSSKVEYNGPFVEIKQWKLESDESSTVSDSGREVKTRLKQCSQKKKRRKRKAE